MVALVNEKEMGLQELAAVLESDSKQDYAVPSDQMAVTLDGANCEDTHVFWGGSSLPMTRFAADQLHGRLSNGLKGVSETLRKHGMRDEYRNVVGNLLDKQNAVYRVRTLDNDNMDGRHARAVVSDKYKPIDDDVIFGTALPMIDSKRFQGLGGNKTDLRTAMKFIEREPSLIIPSGNRNREFHLGFMLHNSEVGAGSASFMMFMSDSWCTNGCIFSKEMLANISYRHIGSRIDVRHGLITQADHDQAELLGIQRLISNATANAMSMKGMEKIKASITASVNRHVERDMSEFISDAGKEFKLTKKETEELPLYFQRDEDTQMGLQAAITALAQDKTYERRLQLEAIGGNVLMMPERKWNALAVA